MSIEQRSWTLRPMSEMPDVLKKSGKEFLLRVRHRAGCPNCFLVGHWMEGGHCISDHPPIAEGWYFWNGCYFDRAAEPIAWAELPE